MCMHYQSTMLYNQLYNIYAIWQNTIYSLDIDVKLFYIVDIYSIFSLIYLSTFFSNQIMVCIQFNFLVTY